MTLELNHEVLSAILAGLAWICGGVSALVALAWKLSSRSQKLLDTLENLEKTSKDHEKRIRRIERIGNVIPFPK